MLQGEIIMKKLLALFTAAFMIFTCVSVSAMSNKAEDTKKTDTSVFTSTPDDDQKEEKIYCNATIDDDFADNKILVMYFNKPSLDKLEYTFTAEDFKNIGAVEVKNLDPYIIPHLIAQRNGTEPNIFVRRQNTLKDYACATSAVPNPPMAVLLI